MNDQISNKSDKWIKAHRFRRKWRLGIGILACLVVFGTAWLLVLPAITMERAAEILNCPLSIHEHTEDCYNSEGNLICGQADFVIHVHDAGCYDTAGELVCKLPEIPAHEHTESCFDEEENLICENAAVLHEHTETCYDSEGNLVCGMPEVLEHQHEAECFAAVSDSGEKRDTDEDGAAEEEEVPEADDTKDSVPVVDTAAKVMSAAGISTFSDDEESVSVSDSIIFLHQPQDNENFKTQDTYRPYEGFGSTEPTNYVKFILILENEDGTLKKITDGNGNVYPDVELPEGSVVPERYEFELGEDGILTVTQKTFAGISVPGYSYDTSYVYFGWTSNADMQESNMAIVNTFQNFGRMSSAYNNTYYSVVGYTTSRGNPGYNDYSYKDFGNKGNGYYAYNPTGCLMLVLKPVSETIAYKTSYHNDFVPGGTAKQNVVDVTDARMLRNAQGEWYGEAIMTELDTNDPAQLASPGEGWTFAGWYDSCDAEGNGEGNKITGREVSEDGKTYYFAVTPDGEKIIITQNNDIYARWEKESSGIELPATGGQGTWFYTFGGLILLITCLMYRYILKKGKETI